MAIKPAREVVVAGVGLHAFGRFPKESFHDMARDAVLEALEDSGAGYRDIQAAYFGHVYYHGMSVGEVVLQNLGLTGIPVTNVENACSSGSTGLWQAFWAVANGMYDVALAFGAEKVPRGPVSVTAEYSPERMIGADHMMATYALQARRYMEDYGAPVEAFAHVSVRCHKNAAMNPYAHHKKAFTMEEVLESRMITEPLTLYQCCPTSEGASAAVICAKEVADKYMKDKKRVVTIAGAALRTTMSAGIGGPGSTDVTTLTAKEAYEIAGLGPEDMDIVQVHDAATNASISQIESMGLVERGKGWQLELDGGTEIDGKLPVNTDGGLQGMGHPFGATGIRMVHEIVTQLRGEAGERQVKNPKVGIAQCSGAGGVCTVHILKK